MITFPQGVRPPQALPYAIVGCGPGSFIGLCAWLPTIEADRRFKFAGAAPSRKAEGVEWFVDTLGVDSTLVLTDYKDLVLKMNRKYGARWVLCVTTETPSHAEIVCWALEHGVKYIVMDKPMVTSTAEADAINTLAAKKGAIVVVTFNHRYNAGIFTIRQAVTEVLQTEGPSGIAEVNGWFLQGWLKDDPKIRQSDWRLSHPWCALLDIWSHAYDLAEFALGSPGIKILDAQCGTGGNHGRKVYDHGRGNVEFQNGVRALIECSQVLPGHLDDIGLLVRFANPARRTLMFSMEFGGTDGIFVGDQNAKADKLADWTLIPRGNTEGVPAAVADSVGLNPPAHWQGWGDMWRLLFASAAGLVHVDLGELTREQLPGQMKLPVPLAGDAGKTTIYAVSALAASHEGGGERLIIPAAA